MRPVFLHPDRLSPPSRAAQGFDGLILQPGKNLLSDEDCIKLVNHPDFDRFHDCGAISLDLEGLSKVAYQAVVDKVKEVLPDEGDVDEDETPTQPDPEPEVRATKARIAVSDDPAQLKAWLAGLSSRSSLRAAIHKRLAELEA